MSDLDSLIATFQTQLSDVMETVVRTTMFEVTRLVEDGFLQELKRRDREVESLRVQLQWTERKLSDEEGEDGKKSAKGDVELSDDLAEQGPEEQQEDTLRDWGVKKEAASVESWTSTQEVTLETAQSAGNPVPTHSVETLATEDVLSAGGVKEEHVSQPSCSSVHLGGWSAPLESEAEAGSLCTETTETHSKPSQEDSEELLRNAMQQDLHISSAYVFSEEHEDTHVGTDPSSEVDSGWAGLTVAPAALRQNHRLATEEDCDAAKSRGAGQELANSVTADVNVLVSPRRGQISSSVSPATRSRNSTPLGVAIKQEVVVDSDGCVESEHRGKKMRKFGMTSFSKQRRLASEQFKQNRFSHKATVQEVMKLHSKVGAGLRLQAAIQHLHRPMRKPPHTLSNTTASSVAHSQAVNLNPLSRTPSTSKGAPPPSLSIQRVHLGDKVAAAHNRTCAPWVSIKNQLQSANSQHANPSPHLDSHGPARPRHLLRCGQCGKCFPHPSNLSAHLQTHTGERPFCCSLCGRSFTKLSNLKAHRRVHTGERPYCCLACGKCFTQKCNMKRHQRIHQDV